jgi:hypothetical protein
MCKQFVIKVQNGRAKRYDTQGNSYNTYSTDKVQSGLIQENEAVLTLLDGHVKIFSLEGSLKKTI